MVVQTSRPQLNFCALEGTFYYKVTRNWPG